VALGRVLIVGDSQAAGPVGHQLERDLQAAGTPTHRIAYSGHGAFDWTQLHWDEYQDALARFAPTDVLMIFGSNDSADAQLDAAFRRFKSAGAPALGGSFPPPRVWYAGPPQYPTLLELQQKSAAIRALAQRVFGARHLDAWPHTGSGVPRAADGVHFAVAGGAQWARAILSSFRARVSFVPVVLVAGLAGIVGAIWLLQWRE
jgi:hypothetical protein